MEKRAVVAVVICAAIFLLWILVLQPIVFPAKDAPPKKKPAETPKKSEEAPRGAAEELGRPSGREKTSPQGVSFPHKTVIVEYGKYEAHFTTRGGGIERLILKVNGGPKAEILAPMEPDRPHFALRSKDASEDLAKVDWKVVRKEGEPEKIAFEYPVDGKWKVVKIFTFDKAKYVFKVFVEFQSLDGKTHEDVGVTLYPFGGIQHDGDYRSEEFCRGFVGLRSGDSWSLKEWSVNDVILDHNQPTAVDASDRDWLGIKNRYFAAVIVPDSDRERKKTKFQLNCLSTRAWLEQGKKKNIVTLVPFEPFTIGEKPRPFLFLAYVGPIRDQELSELPRGLTELYDPSGFNFLAAVILWILNLGYSLSGNYGVAILFTTIVVRLCLFPLSKKSQVSMARIQQLQPKIQIIRERYKDDQQRAGMEQMKLFRENKVNPMSGCLPLLLQLPIFIGMYGVLDSAFDLRRQPFFAWITDLSMPDRLLGPWASFEVLFFSVDALNLLPIVMTITWFLQSYFTPKPQDPQMRAQARMMMFMPIFFGVLCYNLASGLSFYFFMNSLLSMGEMKLIKKVWIPKPDPKSGRS